MTRLRVVIESPFGSRVDGTRCTPEELEENTRYLLRCLEHSLRQGEAPFASHGIYPPVLEDATPVERRMGMEAGFAWGEQAELVAVYVDRGITPGMAEGIERYRALGIQVEHRWLELPGGHRASALVYPAKVAR